MEQLYTCWGENLDRDHVLMEYPRPLLVRDSYLNLNGYWDYAFTKEYKQPERYEGKILVPFSPEAVLSGVNRQLQPDEYLWYHRVITEEELEELGKNELFSAENSSEQNGSKQDALKSCNQEDSKGNENDSTEIKRVLLHFGAVDQACRVFVNGKNAGAHTGGYLPFELDITEYLHAGENELLVAVKDLSDTSYHARGKQKLKSGGMFYTAQSGIWQTVWMECVPQQYIRSVETKSDLEKGVIKIKVNTGKHSKEVMIEIREPEIYKDSMRMPQDVVESMAIFQRATGVSDTWIEIPLKTFKLWNCETPYLYYFTVTMGEDQIVSYFAMREFSLIKQVSNQENSKENNKKINNNKIWEEQIGNIIQKWNAKLKEVTEKGKQKEKNQTESIEVPRICLNGEIQFQNGVLDQGYWPDGLYTAPSDEAFIFDLEEMKKTGFNMVRKHLKIEPQRWYYHCDRLGMVVWQDMVNGGSCYKHWFVTYLATLMSWMKISMRDIYPKLLSRETRAGRHEFVREMKETVQLLKGHPSIAAWVIFNEGWGQFQTEDMTRILREEDPDRLIDQASGWFDQGGGDFSSLHNYFFKLFIRTEEKRASVLSEFGGYSYRVEGHSACPKLYGYGICKNEKELNHRYQDRGKKMRGLIPEGLCASVYTQWSDIEEEVNGVYTYDRKVRKIKESID
nr:sugar-binding domain-containing protein [uncultured Mediterraneibacter sp.]